MWVRVQKMDTWFSVHRWPRLKQRFRSVELWASPPRHSSWGIIWVGQMHPWPCTTLERGQRVLPCPTVHLQLTSYWKVNTTAVEVSQYRRALTLPQLKLLPGKTFLTTLYSDLEKRLLWAERDFWVKTWFGILVKILSQSAWRSHVSFKLSTLLYIRKWRL